MHTYKFMLNNLPKLLATLKLLVSYFKIISHAFTFPGFLAARKLHAFFGSSFIRAHSMSRHSSVISFSVPREEFF